MTDRPRVVIIGAGFGGLWAAKRLANKPVDVTLIDRNNFHTFFPLLYQVAAAELKPSDIVYPIRTIIRKFRNTTFRLGDVTDIDLDDQSLTVDGERLEYDHLVLAPGSTTRYFGIDGAEEHAFALRTLDDGIVLRNHVLDSFERASQVSDPTERQRLLRFVIIGGGPTGVEYSGALQEFLNRPFRKDFPDLADSTPEVITLEAGDRLLSMYPERLSDYAKRRLMRMGVDVRLDSAVERVDATGCVVNGERIDANTVIWTAGVGGSAQFGSWGLPGAPAEKVAVDSNLQVEGRSNVYVVGDVAFNTSGHGPMVCQNALQQGRLAADNILRSLSGKTPESFEYRDLGNMAVIGRNAAVVHLWNRIPLSGFLAWVIWLTLHLVKLVGFRNRLAAVGSWAGDYFTGDRVARLIIPGRRSG